MLELLLAWQLAQPRGYHRVTMADLADGTRWTHVCTTGPVVYKRKQADGDWHITLDDGKSKIVLEIVPDQPVTVPKKGDTVEACGISRLDTHHKWWEIHPVETLTVLPKKAKR